MYRIIILAAILATFALLASCSGSADPANTTQTVSCDAQGDTPTAAYKRLYEAVKAKNLDGIKGAMTTGSIQFAEGISAQQKTPIEKVFENGFTGSTFSPTLPELRDERISCNMASLEAWNPEKQLWDDLPFMIEGGKWKLAIGELFKGSFKTPGKGMAQREAEAANAANGNTVVPFPTNNTNTNKPKLVQIPGQAANKPPVNK